MADESQENLEGDSICELCHFILVFKRKNQDIRNKEQKVEVTHTIFWQMQPQSWIKPHSIQNVIKPSQKLILKHYNPSWNTTPSLPILAFLNSYMDTMKWEQHLEPRFLWNQIKMIFIDSLNLQGLAKLVRNYKYE